MHKMPLLFLVVLFTSGFSNYADGQNPGEWMWIHGDNTPNSAGYFGTQGVSSALNEPPCLYEPCEWTDLQGNFWMFGGHNGDMYNALWKYNPATNQWTWMKGSSTPNDAGYYGIMGVSSPLNNPPSRSLGAATWTDTSGNFWMFGGTDIIYTPFNDLWKYDVSSNEWTWISGSTLTGMPPVYGTQGVSSPGNTPGGKSECVATWRDSADGLWLFGGYDCNSHDYNDLWRYSISLNEWTWMKGSGIPNQTGVYGSLGIEDSSNIPGGRSSYAHWKNNNGNFCFFGGVSFHNDWLYNDTWMYNPLTNNWTWFGGSNFHDDPGSYYSQCYSSLQSLPHARYENRACFYDNCTFYMFGGSISCTGPVFINDLWAFCDSSHQWTWINGDSTASSIGNWGTKGVSSPTNKPEARSGSIGWTDFQGHFYFFGGANLSTNRNNDLWSYTFDSTCFSCACTTTPSAIFTSSNTLCPGTCTNFLNLSNNATSYQWSFPGATPNTSTVINPMNICYPASGSYDVQLIATNANGSDTLLLANYITVYPSPPPQGITQNGDTLFAIAGATSYQWYFNGNIISGATDYFYVASQGGDYNIVATDANGCEVEAAIFNVLASTQFEVASLKFEVYPNPVGDKVTIHPDSYRELKVTSETAADVSIYDVLGEKMSIEIPSSVFRLQSSEINVQALSPGLYYLEITLSEKIFRSKFVKQ